MGRFTRLVVGGLFALLVFASSAAALSAEGVFTGRGNTWDPAEGYDSVGGHAYLSWTQYVSGRSDAWYRRDGGGRIRLNTNGLGWSWGMDPAITTIAYQQAVRGNSNIKLYDWSTFQRSSPGSLVNTPHFWEYEPSISGQWLLFGRLNRQTRPARRRLYLYNTVSTERRLLDSFDGGLRRGTILVGQVNGDWAVWSKVSNRGSNWSVFRYRISTETTERIPRPAGRYDYAPSVTDDGTVYFVRSGNACGKLVRLRSYDIHGVAQVLYSSPDGRDIGKTFAAPQPDGSTDIYFDSWRCSARVSNGNIYRVNIPAGGGTLAAATADGVRLAGGPKRIPARLDRAAKGRPVPSH